MPAGSYTVIDDVQLNLLLFDPGGPVADEVHRVAETTILEIARATLSNPYPGGPAPPPGPPYLRTGELRDSLIVVDSPGGSTVGPETTIQPTAIHRGWNYGEILRDRGYRFLPPSFYL